MWDLYTVAVIVHGNTKKLDIGSLSFNILVTAAIDLVTGTISVGAGTSLQVSGKSRLWCRTDRGAEPSHGETTAVQVRRPNHLFLASVHVLLVCVLGFLSSHDFRTSESLQAQEELRHQGYCDNFDDILKTLCIKKNLLEGLLVDMGEDDALVVSILLELLEPSLWR